MIKQSSKSKFVKEAFAFATIAIGATGYSRSTKTDTQASSLDSLPKVSNTNAEVIARGKADYIYFINPMGFSIYEAKMNDQAGHIKLLSKMSSYNNK